MVDGWLSIREVVGAGFLPPSAFKLDPASRIVGCLAARVLPGASLDKLEPGIGNGHGTTKDFCVWILGVADEGDRGQVENRERFKV